MKNKGLIITLIILLAIIVICLIAFLVACLRENIMFSKGFIFLGEKNTNKIFEQEYEAQDIENLEILEESGDIKFEETSQQKIKIVVYGENEEDVEVTLNENKLKVNYTKNKISFLNLGNHKNNITIYIPSNYSNTINVKNNYGNCEINDLENATIDIDCDCGNVELGKVKNAKIKCDYGNVEIESVLNKCDIRSDCGNVEIKKLEINEDSSIKCDLGNIDIEEINDIYVQSEVDLGKTNISKNNTNSEITLTLKCDCGNVNIGK